MTKAHRTQTINKAHPNGVGPLSQDDPYLRLNCDQHPQYIAFDAFMYPGVALSVMLTAQSEFDMLTAVFGSGMAIEAGENVSIPRTFGTIFGNFFLPLYFFLLSRTHLW